MPIHKGNQMTISIKSSKRWGKLGLFKDTESVYVTHPSNSQAFVISKETHQLPSYYGCTKVGPAPNAEEMVAFLFKSGLKEKKLWGLQMTLLGGWYLHRDDRCVDVTFKSESLTEALEQAINWDLDRNAIK